MITLTTEIKSRTLRECDRYWLYNKIRRPFYEKKEEFHKAFADWVDKNILTDILNPDLLKLGEKPYCARCISHFAITPKELGLDDYYFGIPEDRGLCISLNFEYSSKYEYAILNSTIGCRCINITKRIVEKCSPKIIDQVKYFLFELAKTKFEYKYFGFGTDIKDKHEIFKNIRTWGNLYSTYPEMFELLYENVYGDSNQVEDYTEPELKLLDKLKSSLGY